MKRRSGQGRRVELKTSLLRHEEARMIWFISRAGKILDCRGRQIGVAQVVIRGMRAHDLSFLRGGRANVTGS